MAFDKLLIHSADVLEHVAGAQDAHGNKPTTWTTKEQAVPCRLSSGRTKPRERLAGEKWSEDYRVVFMRPREYALTEHHDLLISGQRMNIIQVLVVADGKRVDHHLEVWCQVVKA